MRHGFRSLLLASLVFVCLENVATLASWDIEPIQTTGDIGWNVNLDLDSAGVAHASYYRQGSSTGYEYRDGSSWLSGTALDSGTHDFALDNNGIPHVFVRQYDGASHLRLAKLNSGGTWDLVTYATGSFSQSLSLDFGTLNRPHLGYIDTVSQSLMYAIKNGDSWQTQTVASAGSFQYGNSSANMALDSAGNAQFIYRDFDDDYLYHVLWNGSSWVSQAIDQGYGGSMVFDSANNLHISYKGLSGSQMYGKYNGSIWTTSTVETDGDARSDIYLDPWERPHIVYGINRGAGPQTDTLKHAYYTGSSWSREVIDTWPSTLNGSEDQAIAIDDLGNVQIVFSDDSKNFYSARLEAPSQFEITPTFDAWATSSDGSNFTVTDGDTGIMVQRIPWADIYRRGILEFDISALPPAASVSSASLELDILSYTYDEDEFPLLSIYGYTGDGELSSADALNLTDLIGQYEVHGLDLITIDLDPAFIESLLGSTSYLGMVAYGDPNDHQVYFAATESLSFAPPRLNITMAVPELATLPGDVNGDGWVGEDDLSIVISNWGHSGLGRAGGDLNDNGVVDGPDYAEVLSYWNPPSEPPLEAVPEPATLGLMLVGGFVLIRRHWPLNK